MNKNILLFTLLSLLSVGFVYGQTSGWETGMTVSAGVCDQFYTQIRPEAKPLMGFIKNDDVPALYYSAGVYGRKFFKKSYGIELGVQYTSFSEGGQKMEAIDETGTVIGTSKINFRQNFVEIPVRFVFKKDLGLFSVGCFAGLAPAFLTHAQQRAVVTPTEGKRYVETTPKTGTNFNLFADAGLLVRANLSKCFALDLKPFFRTAVFPSAKPGTKTDYQYYYRKHAFAGGLTVAGVWKF